MLAQAGSFHSLYSNGQVCFAIQERASDAAIVQVGTDLSLSGVRSSLTKGEPMSWTSVGEDVYYSNGFQNGYIKGGISYPWPVGSYNGPDTTQVFEAAPVGHIVAFKPGGLMFIAEGSTLWICHEPFAFGLFNKRSGFVQFDSKIQMVCPTAEGVFVSDAKATRFLRGTSWFDFIQQKVLQYPALYGSLAHDTVDLGDLGISKDGTGYIWASTQGVCLGLDNGSAINLTENKVNYPQGYTSGACLVTDTHIIHTVEN